MERTNEAGDDEVLIGIPVRAHRVLVERVQSVPHPVRSYEFVPRVIEIGVREERAWLEPATDRARSHVPASSNGRPRPGEATQGDESLEEEEKPRREI